MRRIGLTILAALILVISSIGGAVASQPETTGPPNDPPCEQGQAGQHNPNCEEDDDTAGQPGNPGNQPGANRPPENRPPDNRPPDNRPPDNRPPDTGPPPPPPAEACPGGLEVPLGDLLYACVILLPEDADHGAECPDGTVIELPLEPVVYACVTLFPVDNGDDVPDVVAATTAGPPDNRPPENRPPDNRPPDNRPPDNRPPDNRPPDGPDPDPDRCPGGLEVPVGDLAYVCLILFTDDDHGAQCPDGAVPIELGLEPLAYACVVLFLDDPDVPDTPGVIDVSNVIGAALR